MGATRTVFLTSSSIDIFSRKRSGFAFEYISNWTISFSLLQCTIQKPHKYLLRHSTTTPKNNFPVRFQNRRRGRTVAERSERTRSWRASRLSPISSEKLRPEDSVGSDISKGCELIGQWKGQPTWGVLVVDDQLVGPNTDGETKWRKTAAPCTQRWHQLVCQDPLQVAEPTE